MNAAKTKLCLLANSQHSFCFRYSHFQPFDISGNSTAAKKNYACSYLAA